MKPVLITKSGNDKLLCEVISCLLDIDCTRYFRNHIGMSQVNQRIVVNSFQELTVSRLGSSFGNIEWIKEYSASQSKRDSIDIFGKGDGLSVIIELDKFRADQVAKKFVSRMALVSIKRTYYISLCYPGTRYMNRTECEKYFQYCSILAQRMGTFYAGMIIT